MTYLANEARYERMTYRRCGKSGLKLPEISLGLWHKLSCLAKKTFSADELTQINEILT